MTIFRKHNLMSGMIKLLIAQPSQMRLRPERAARVEPAMTEQKSLQLLACPFQRYHRALSSAHQIAHRLMLPIRNPYRRQLTGTV